MIRRTYFGLHEIYKFIKQAVNEDAEDPIVDPVAILNAYAELNSGLAQDYGIYWDFTNDLFASDFDDVFKYLLNEHRGDYFYYIDLDWKSELPALDEDICLEAFARLVSNYQASKDKYLLLLNFYKTKKNNLLKAVETTQIHLFNDTPQNFGDYTNESHLSTYDKTTTENEYDSLMGRIEEVQQKYRNLVKDWANEFRNLFYFN